MDFVPAKKIEDIHLFLDAGMSPDDKHFSL